MTRFFLALVAALMLFASASVYAETTRSAGFSGSFDSQGNRQACVSAGMSNGQSAASIQSCYSPNTRNITTDVNVSRGSFSGNVGGSYNRQTGNYSVSGGVKWSF